MFNHITDNSRFIFIEPDTRHPMYVVKDSEFKGLDQLVNAAYINVTKNVTKAMIERSFHRLVKFNSDIVLYTLNRSFAKDVLLDIVAGSSVSDRVFYNVHNESSCFTYYEQGYEISENCPTGTITFVDIKERVYTKKKTDIFIDSFQDITIMPWLPICAFAHQQLLTTKLNVCVGMSNVAHQRWVKSLRATVKHNLVIGGSALYVV